MSHPEQLQDRILENETALPRSWKSYAQQLGERFQVRITEPDSKLVLCRQDPQRRLLISTQRAFAVVSHGRTTEGYDLLPEAEILFDVTEVGDWMPSEIMYSDEAWDEYQERLKQSNLPPTEEQTFDGERFAQYLLDKVVREEWIAVRV